MRTRSTIARMALPAITVALAAACLLPAGAAGGVYTVAQCHQTLNPVQGDAVAERSSTGHTLTDTCSTGAGLSVVHDGPQTGSGAYGRWVWRAPPGTVFTNLVAAARLVNGSGEQASLTGVGSDGQEVTFGSPGTDWEPFDQLPGEFTGFRSGLRCAAGGGCPAGGSAQADVRDVLLSTDDRLAPTASITSGSLFDGVAVRGVRTAEFQAVDQGGGIRRLELLVNGALVFERVLDCQVAGGVATSLQPCPGQGGASVSVSTSDDPFLTGANQITACAADLALDGRPNRGCESRDIFVDDICPASTVGAGSSLSARFSGGKATARMRSDRRPQLTGTLTSDSGDGIGGAKICALTRVKLAGEPYEVADTAKTAANGRYRLKLPAGASREVYVDRVFGDAVLARHGLSVKSSVRPSLEVSPPKKQGRLKQGQRLRFRGKLPGPGCKGRVVKVQAKVGKRRWQVFRSVRTNGKCRYRTRFKLRATNQPTRYLFRVRVPQQVDYPYVSGKSTVRVREAGRG